MGIKHPFVSGVADAADTSKVRPSNWNANHVIDGDVDFGGFDALNVGNAAMTGPPGPTGPTGPTGPQGSPGPGTQYYVNVKDFGATGDFVTDDAAAIQAAIDYAYANQYGTVYIPSGHYKINSSIWLDPPINGRGGNFNHPVESNFTLRLVGDGFGGSNFPGTHMFCNVNGIVALYVGPGQRMGVSGIGIQGVAVSAPRFSALTCPAGIYIMGGAGGAHVTDITDCEIFYFQNGIQIAGNFDSLGDSTTVTRCQIRNCTYGCLVESSQQFINAFRDCTMVNCKTAFRSFFNLAIEVSGGNYSCDCGGYATYDMDTVTAFAGAGAADNSGENGFSGALEPNTITVHLPGTGTGFIDPLYTVEQDRFAIDTTHFGVVPFYKVDWNPSTKILTLQLVGDWIRTLFDGAITAPQDFMDLITDLQAATKLYAAVQITIFRSAGCYAQGIHVENANTLVLLARVAAGWQVSVDSKLEDVYLNWDPSFSDIPAINELYALNILATAWPFILQDNATNLFIDNLRGPGNSRTMLYLNTGDGGGTGGRCQINNMQMEVNVKGPGLQNYPLSGNDLTIESAGRGYGEFDRTPFKPTYSVGGNVPACLWQLRNARTPFTGYNPAPWTLPTITADQLDTIQTGAAMGTDTSFALSDQVTPPLCGNCLYRVAGYYANNSWPELIRFDHSFWSWGVDFNSVWSHKGNSPFMYFDTFGMSRMFAGLVIGLDYSTGPSPGIHYYVVLAVHYQRGYIETARLVDSQFRFSYPFSGVLDTTLWTGTIVRQQAWRLNKLGNIRAAALTDSHIAGKKFWVGDQIWQSVPTAGTSMGWICTTAGIAGAGAVFKVMANLT